LIGVWKERNSWSGGGRSNKTQRWAPPGTIELTERVGACEAVPGEPERALQPSHGASNQQQAPANRCLSLSRNWVALWLGGSPKPARVHYRGPRAFRQFRVGLRAWNSSSNLSRVAPIPSHEPAEEQEQERGTGRDGLAADCFAPLRPECKPGFARPANTADIGPISNPMCGFGQLIRWSPTENIPPCECSRSIFGLSMLPTMPTMPTVSTQGRRTALAGRRPTRWQPTTDVGRAFRVLLQGRGLGFGEDHRRGEPWRLQTPGSPEGSTPNRFISAVHGSIGRNWPVQWGSLSRLRRCSLSPLTHPGKCFQRF
jgi:hypothetical protein